MTVPKPTFLIIGAPKCGTTSLAKFFDSHPDCCFSRPKEANYFQENLRGAPNENFDKGWSWYRGFFEHYAGEPVIGESTPAYSRRRENPGAAKRIHGFNPQMKIVYAVRHPLHRMVSHWKMGWAGELRSGAAANAGARHGPSSGFEEWLTKSPDRLFHWDASRYDYNLSAYRGFFPDEQIAVTFLEDWALDQEKELRRLAAFVGLDPSRAVIEAPRGVNRADERRQARPWFQWVRERRALQPLRSLAPQRLRYLLGRHLGTAPAVPPQPALSAESMNAFLDYVAEDSRLFLRRYGKPDNFWSGAPVNGL